MEQINVEKKFTLVRSEFAVTSLAIHLIMATELGSNDASSRMIKNASLLLLTTACCLHHEHNHFHGFGDCCHHGHQYFPGDLEMDCVQLLTYSILIC
jgi:hypothetical protein